MTINKFTKDNAFLMLALDHRSSFRKLVASSGKTGNVKTMITYKQKILDSVWDQCSGILLDPNIGKKALDNLQKADKQYKPYLLCLEKTGYQEKDGIRLSSLQYSVNDLRNKGADGVKLLLYINPNAETKRQNKQFQIAKQAANQAKRENIPLFLELITYGTEKPNVSRAVSLFLKQDIIPDVFKLEYPGSPQACTKVSDNLGNTPWILLTRGKSFDIFKAELSTAISTGASGFLAGRALWQEIFELDEKEEKKFLNCTLPERFGQISRIVLKKDA